MTAGEDAGTALYTPVDPWQGGRFLHINIHSTTRREAYHGLILIGSGFPRASPRRCRERSRNIRPVGFAGPGALETASQLSRDPV